jgi:type II secretion system protein H
LTTGPRNSAFTLLELLLVLVVIGLVLAVAAPSMRGFSASRQTADAALRTLALTQWCHNEAITGGHRVRLMVETQGQVYSSWASWERGGQFVDADGESGRHWDFPEGATARIRLPGADAAQEPTYVEFHPSGRHEAATFEITGQQGDVQRVTCDSPTEAFRHETPGEGGQQ